MDPGVTRAIADGGAGQVTGPRPDLGELPELAPIPAHDERPALEVLAASGVAAGLQDAIEVVGVERAVGEIADDPDRGDGPEDRIRRGSGSRTGSVTVRRSARRGSLRAPP